MIINIRNKQSVRHDNSIEDRHLKLFKHRKIICIYLTLRKIFVQNFVLPKIIVVMHLPVLL